MALLSGCSGKKDATTVSSPNISSNEVKESLSNTSGDTSDEVIKNYNYSYSLSISSNTACIEIPEVKELNEVRISNDTGPQKIDLYRSDSNSLCMYLNEAKGNWTIETVNELNNLISISEWKSGYFIKDTSFTYSNSEINGNILVYGIEDKELFMDIYVITTDINEVITSMEPLVSEEKIYSNQLYDISKGYENSCNQLLIEVSDGTTSDVMFVNVKGE